jgi:hypothetical protein
MPRLRLSIPWLCVVGALCVGPAAAQDGDEADEAVLDRTPEDCVITTRIRKTKIVDDGTILFYLGGSKVYQNVLPDECPRLKSNGRFAYQVRSSRLCRVDTITVLDRFGGDLRPGFTCRLGRFLPITELEADALLLAADEKKTKNEDVGLDQFEVKPVEPPPEDDSADNTR